MVEVEIRSPIFSEESGQVEWRSRAFVRAEGQEIDFYGERDVIHPELPVASLSTGRSIISSDDPEEWARSLPHAYRSGDLIAVVRLDTSQPEIGEGEPLEEAPTIPEPPETTIFASETTLAATS